MELSVCIPVYNENINTLVRELIAQLNTSGINYEINLIDDNSQEKYKLINRPVVSLSNHINYEELEKNIGRSKIRNRLATQAKGKYILFLDCDVQILNKSFIQNYINYYLENQDLFANRLLVRGGYKYLLSETEKKGRELRYKYGKEVEEAKLDVNGKVLVMPYLGGNFLVEQSVFKTIQFDESIVKYGYEDFLFNVDYLSSFKENDNQAINNPVVMNKIDTNEEFLLKTKEAMETLAFLVKKRRILIEDQLRILIAYNQLKTNGLLPVIVGLAKSSMPLLLFNLTSKSPNLKLFQLLKLIYFTEAMNS